MGQCFFMGMVWGRGRKRNEGEGDSGVGRGRWRRVVGMVEESDVLNKEGGIGR